eukprot:comp5838_c0_seq1/m.1691 comp5838_c0_seq1/g.1691  ORF comp5838_c0_seq1/g.1691 comp5838_c0_seq1/m.1691 type:complete len:174 (-) comp5838_c0_seq1:537-1058(-)
MPPLLNILGLLIPLASFAHCRGIMMNSEQDPLSICITQCNQQLSTRRPSKLTDALIFACIQDCKAPLYLTSSQKDYNEQENDEEEEQNGTDANMWLLLEETNGENGDDEPQPPQENAVLKGNADEEVNFAGITRTTNCNDVCSPPVVRPTETRSCHETCELVKSWDSAGLGQY